MTKKVMIRNLRADFDEKSGLGLLSLGLADAHSALSMCPSSTGIFDHHLLLYSHRSVGMTEKDDKRGDSWQQKQGICDRPERR